MVSEVESLPSQLGRKVTGPRYLEMLSFCYKKQDTSGAEERKKKEEEKAEQDASVC